MKRLVAKPQRAFVIVWEFHVPTGKRRAFEVAYGPEGDWVRLFKTGVGYIRTDLIRDLNSANRFLTLDYWRSLRDYEEFRKKNRDAYFAIDQKWESLTTKEAEIGRFTLKL